MEKISYKEYESREGFRQSYFKALNKSPGHYIDSINNPTTSEALSFGRAFHAYILEPEVFDSEFVVEPKADARTKEGKAIKAEFAAKSQGKEILSADDFEVILAMKYAILAHETAKKIIELSPEREQSIFWADPETGVKCKARLDMVCRELGACVDLKSTEDASLKEFSRSLAKWGYHFQAAHTLNGCAANNENIDAFIFIAVEKKAPHGVAVYQIGQDSLLVGAKKIQGLLRIFKSCSESQQWPIYPETIQPIELPRWELKEGNYDE